MTSHRLRILIKDDPVLSEKFEGLTAAQKGLLLGAMARIDNYPADKVEFCLRTNSLHLDGVYDLDDLSSFGRVLEFFDPQSSEANREVCHGISV